MNKEPAFAFVLEEMLSSRLANQVRVKPMFGAHAIYLADKITLILRHRGGDTHRDDGIWVVIAEGSLAAIRTEFPALRPIESFKKKSGPPSWWNLPETARSFEADAGRIVDLLIRGDARFGKIPKSKSVKAAQARKTK